MAPYINYLLIIYTYFSNTMFTFHKLLLGGLLTAALAVLCAALVDALLDRNFARLNFRSVLLLVGCLYALSAIIILSAHINIGSSNSSNGGVARVCLCSVGRDYILYIVNIELGIYGNWNKTNPLGIGLYLYSQ